MKKLYEKYIGEASNKEIMTSSMEQIEKIYKKLEESVKKEEIIKFMHSLDDMFSFSSASRNVVRKRVQLGENSDHKSLLTLVTGIRNYISDLEYYVKEDESELFEYVKVLKDTSIKIERIIKGVS